MIRYYGSAVLLWSLLSPMPGFAQEDLFEELSGSGILFSYDRSFPGSSFQGFEGIILSRDGVEISARRMLFSPEAGAIRLEDAFISSPDTDVSVRIGRLTSNSLSSLDVLFAHPSCFSSADSPSEKIQIEAENILFSTSPASVTMLSRERMSVDRINYDLDVDEASGCILAFDVTFSEVLLSSSDRSRMLFDHLNMASRPSREGSLDVGFMINGFQSQDLQLDKSIFLDSARVSLDVDGLPDRISVRDFETLIGSSEFDFKIGFDGLQLLSGGAMSDLSGSSSFGISSDTRVLNLSVTSDLPSLLTLDGLARFSVTPDFESGPALVSLFGDIPGISLVEKLSFDGGELFIQDRGFLRFIEPITGFSQEDAISFLSSLSARLPGPISAPLTDFFEAIFQDGATVRSSPEEPVSVVQAIMTGLIQPGRLGAMFGISTE